MKHVQTIFNKDDNTYINRIITNNKNHYLKNKNIEMILITYYYARTDIIMDCKNDW